LFGFVWFGFVWFCLVLFGCVWFLLSVMSKVVASFLIFPVVEQAFHHLTALNFL
jgi:hypothetical protein